MKSEVPNLADNEIEVIPEKDWCRIRIHERGGDWNDWNDIKCSIFLTPIQLGEHAMECLQIALTKLETTLNDDERVAIDLLLERTADADRVRALVPNYERMRLIMMRAVLIRLVLNEEPARFTLSKTNP